MRDLLYENDLRMIGSSSRPASGKAMIVGGGFFGIYLALILHKKGISPEIIELDHDLMQRASYHNQARVHNGCHYPRSMITAVRSRVNYPRFVRDFPECIVDGFEKYYAVSRVFSKVNADQYERFMTRAGIPWERAGKQVADLFDPYMIERVWKVREVVFDARVLKDTMKRLLKEKEIPVHYGCEALKVEPVNMRLRLSCSSESGSSTHDARWIFNCTYSRINRLLINSALAPIAVKHELTEISLIEPPPELKKIAVTVMCGPFFSMLPFPPEPKWTLSHVRLTPQYHWTERNAGSYADPYLILQEKEKKTMAELMIRDAARYLPLMKHSRYIDSLWEIKTTLPQSEIDDGRPILVYKDPAMPGFVSILGGKIDNVYDLESVIDEIIS